ncbi:MAG: FAD:protein transferase [Candidatus Aminicenantes bacterium]|nr:FAD:protein transferase [Candidatus Aminicenantes bacterium]
MPPQKPAVLRFAHEAMATLFEVIIPGKDETYAGQAARAAFDEIDRIERLFSRFDPSSEISRITRLGPGEALPVGVETVHLLGLASFVQLETGGAFDVNFRAAAARSPRRPPARPRNLGELIRIEHTGGGFEVVRLRRSRGAAALDLDLGAVGKGFALDSARALLRDWAVDNVLLNAGTSTVLGTGPGPGRTGPVKGWPVGAGSTAGTTAGPGRFLLCNEALSGSGTEVKGEHVVDPRTGRPARGHRAAWASHPSAAAADALSTAFMVMKTGEVARFCARHPEVWALVKIGPEKCRIFNAGAAAAQRPARRRRRR